MTRADEECGNATAKAAGADPTPSLPLLDKGWLAKNAREPSWRWVGACSASRAVPSVFSGGLLAADACGYLESSPVLAAGGAESAEAEVVYRVVWNNVRLLCGQRDG